MRKQHQTSALQLCFKMHCSNATLHYLLSGGTRSIAVAGWLSYTILDRPCQVRCPKLQRRTPVVKTSSLCSASITGTGASLAS